MVPKGCLPVRSYVSVSTNPSQWKQSMEQSDTCCGDLQSPPPPGHEEELLQGGKIPVDRE